MANLDLRRRRLRKLTLGNLSHLVVTVSPGRCPGTAACGIGGPDDDEHMTDGGDGEREHEQQSRQDHSGLGGHHARVTPPPRTRQGLASASHATT